MPSGWLFGAVDDVEAVERPPRSARLKMRSAATTSKRTRASMARLNSARSRATVMVASANLAFSGAAMTSPRARR